MAFSADSLQYLIGKTALFGFSRHQGHMLSNILSVIRKILMLFRCTVLKYALSAGANIVSCNTLATDTGIAIYIKNCALPTNPVQRRVLPSPHR